MKASLFTTITALAASVLASPTALRTRDAAVTVAQLNKFRLFAEYAASPSCNNQNTIGQKVTCPGNFCPEVMTYNVTTAATFSGPLTDIRGIVALDHTNKLIVVAFRGSVSWRNWITDFIFTQIPCDLTLGCLVHTGFFSAWLEVASSVQDAVKAAKTANPGYTIVAVGHSLGGSVATIGAGYLRKAGHAVDLYTFGSPRTGNSFFAKFITSQPGAEFRVTHAADPVARLPPIIFNYRHTSPEYWLQDPAATPADVTLCEGYANLSCNAGTSGFDMSQHSMYFKQVNGCGPETDTPWKRALSDAELIAQLEAWAAADAALVAGLPKDDA